MDASRPSPVCPRCGYDQSGAVATWTDRCPISGTCPECGNGHLWADLFDPSRKDLRWLVEHAPTRARMWPRTPAMVWRVARPDAFWREVGVHTRVRIGRLVLWCAGVLAALHFATGAGLWYNEYRWILTARARARVGWWKPGKQQELQAVLDALTQPLAGLFAGPGWTGASGGWGIGTISVSEFGLPAWLAACLGFTTTWTLVLGVIPTTRRLARIRAVHIARAGVLACFAAFIGVELARIELAINGSQVGRPFVILTGWAGFAGMAALLAWTLRWWWSAARTGWDLRPARLVVLLGFVAALLGAAVSALLCDMQGIASIAARWM